MEKFENDLNIEENNIEDEKTKNGVLNNKGLSTVEIILILVVLIALVVIFRSQIIALVNNIFTSINSNAANVYR